MISSVLVSLTILHNSQIIRFLQENSFYILEIFFEILDSWVIERFGFFGGLPKVSQSYSIEPQNSLFPHKILFRHPRWHAYYPPMILGHKVTLSKERALPSLFRNASVVLRAELQYSPETSLLTPWRMDVLHSRNLFCAALSFWNEVDKWSTSSSSCFLTEPSCCKERLPSPTVAMMKWDRGRRMRKWGGSLGEVNVGAKTLLLILHFDFSKISSHSHHYSVNNAPKWSIQQLQRSWGGAKFRSAEHLCAEDVQCSRALPGIMMTWPPGYIISVGYFGACLGYQHQATTGAVF